MNSNLKYSDFNRFYSFHSKISRIILNNCGLIFTQELFLKKIKFLLVL